MPPSRKLLIVGLALALSACNEASSNNAVEMRPVRTTIAKPQPIENGRSGVGEIKPRYESDIGFRISGKLVARLVDVGAGVRQGDVLARLDDQDYRNRLRSAEADIVAADAVLDESRNAEARQRFLLGRGVTTQANYDTAVKNLRSNEAKVESARAAMEIARDQLRYAVLVADFDGIVTAVGAEPGQIVNTGQMVVRLARPAEKDAVFAVAEAEFHTNPKQPPEVAVSLLSDPTITATGHVREISPVADPTTRTFQVKVTLKAPPEAMRFGASVMGRLKAALPEVILLPGAALFDQGGHPAVWIVDPATMTVSLKRVTVDRYEADRIVVSEGLANGDVIVTAGVNRLRESQAVRLIEGGIK